MAVDDEFLKEFNKHFRSSRAFGPEESIPREEDERRQSRELNEKECKVVGVYENPNGGAFVLLRDNKGRNVPIWIGQAEAQSIHVAMEGMTLQRPLTHDLMRILLERLGATVEYVLIDDLFSSVFYAKLALRSGDQRHEVDCRPSDSIALAVRFKAPIYVAESVLEDGQVQLAEE